MEMHPPGRLYGFNIILIAAKGGDTFPFEPSAPFEPSEPITANDSSVPSSFDSSLPNLFLTNFFHLCYNSLNTLHAYKEKRDDDGGGEDS